MYVFPLVYSIWEDVGDYVLDSKRPGAVAKKKGSYFDGSAEKEVCTYVTSL